MKKLVFLFITILSLNAIAQTSPTEREMKMINEINYVRTNPGEFAEYINDYIAYWEPVDSIIAIAEDLVLVLKAMKPVDSLVFSQELYMACKAHGEWMIENDSFAHSTLPYAENLIAGHYQVRYALISLLIDDGIPSRGHRLNILNPDYTVVACRELDGSIMEVPHVFIQEFQ